MSDLHPAQRPTFPFTPEVLDVEWPLSTGLRTVVGECLGPDGRPAAGVIEFTPSAISATPDGVVITAVPVTVELDEDGRFAQVLATSDEGWFWEAVARFTHTPGKRWTFLLPPGDDPVDVMEATPA